MTTKELIQLVEPAIANASTFRELCNIEQPKEWIKTKKSISDNCVSGIVIIGFPFKGSITYLLFFDDIH